MLTLWVGAGLTPGQGTKIPQAAEPRGGGGGERKEEKGGRENCCGSKKKKRCALWGGEGIPAQIRLGSRDHICSGIQKLERR